MKFNTLQKLTVLVGLGATLVSYLQTEEQPSSVLEPTETSKIQEELELLPEPEQMPQPLLDDSATKTNQIVPETGLPTLESPAVEPPIDLLPLEPQPQSELPLLPGADGLPFEAMPTLPLPRKIDPEDPGALELLPYSHSLPPAIQELPPEISTPTLGVLGVAVEEWGFGVVNVLPNSIAEKMGLERGDVILSVNGTVASSSWEIRSQLEQTKQSGSQGVILIDKVSGRNRQPKHTCHNSCRSPKKHRYQKIWFRLKPKM